MTIRPPALRDVDKGARAWDNVSRDKGFARFKFVEEDNVDDSSEEEDDDDEDDEDDDRSEIWCEFFTSILGSVG